MKNLKKIVNSSVLAIGVLFASSFAANAAIIKHDIISGGGGNIAPGLIGSLTIEVDNNDLNTGLLDTAFGDNITLVELELFSFALGPVSFDAVVDSDNIEAGAEFFSIDADDIGFSPADTWSYSLLFDSFNGGGFMDIFDSNADVVGFSDFTIGEATVTGMPTAVSAPATIAIFSLAMAGLYGRRKQIS